MLGQVCSLIVSIPDLCTLTYFGFPFIAYIVLSLFGTKFVSLEQLADEI